MKVKCSGTDLDCSLAGLLALSLVASSSALPPLPCQWSPANSSTFYTFVGVVGVPEQAKAVCSTLDGGSLVVGLAPANIATLQTKTPLNAFSGAGNDAIVVKLDSSGMTDWYTFLGDTGSDSGFAVTQKYDGSYVIGIQSNANIPTMGGKTPINALVGSNDFLLVQLSSAGAIDWYTFLGGASSDLIAGMISTSDGSVYAVGKALGDIPNIGAKTPIIAYTGGQEALLTKVDTNGNLEWYTFLGEAGGSDELDSITQSADSSIVVSGSAGLDIPTMQGLTPLNPFVAATDVLVAKINPSGTIQWYTFLGGSSLDIGYSISRTADSGFILTGQASANIPTMQGKTRINAFAGSNEFLVVKLDSFGSVEWYTFLGSAANDQATSAAQTPDGGFIIAGYCPANIASIQGKTPLNAYVASNDYMVAKLNSAGSVSWYTFLGGGGAELVNGIAVTLGGEIIIAGNASANIATIQGQTPLNAFTGGGNDEFVIKLKSDGNL